MQQAMYKKQPATGFKFRTQLIAKIHIAKKQLAMDDDVYRDVLKKLTGKTSTKSMNKQELDAVMRHFKRCGFVPSQPKAGKRPNPNVLNTGMMGKIEALLTVNKLHWNYAHSMSQRMFGVANVNWLNRDQLHKLAIALQYHTNRQ